MARRSIAFLAASAVALLVVGCHATRSTSRRLDAYFSELHDRGRFDGAVVVSSSDGVVFARGYGEADVERHVPFTPDTPTDAASLAKTFTAALVLTLADEGVLTLDDPVQRLLPELPYPGVTLRHLLSHSAGLPVLDYDYFDAYLPGGQVRTTERLLAVLAAERPPLAAPPGETFEYSSFGYDLAALAAARAARTSFAQLLARRLLAPLGITSAFVRPGRLADVPSPRTRGYRRTGDLLEANDVFDLEAFHGGSNIYISVRDLDRWSRGFLDGGLPASTLQAAARPATVHGKQAALTLGNWYRTPDATAFWYSGHLQGFHSELFRDVKGGLSIAYTSNNTIDAWMQKSIVRDVRRILDGGAATDASAPPDVDVVRREERHRIAGAWTLLDGRRFAIDVAPARTSLVVDGVSYRLVQVAPTTFYAPGLDWLAGFALDADPSSDEVYVATNVDERWGRRAR